MKEITRIHIAKIAYNVELPAKKELESYLKTLESYGTDTEIIDDIEVRITEILSERGIKKDGVITEADVKALKHQLGEPHEFMTDGDIVGGHEEESKVNVDSVRKLYRNTDNAAVGGVLSGIASFFRIDPVWARLVFIILLLASFGTALLVYVVLWIVVPPARTAADKLQMAGRAVTVGSIRELNESEAGRSTSRDTETLKRTFSILGGVICIICATGAAMLTAAAVIAVTSDGREHLFGDAANAGFFITAFSLAVASGLLLTVLFILGAYASFVRKMTKRVLIAICTVIVLGLVSFGAAIGFVQYGGFQNSQAIEANTREAKLSVPEGIEKASSLVLNDAQNIEITYVVTKDKPSATLRTIQRNDEVITQPKLVIVQNELRIDVAKNSDKNCESTWWCDRARQELVVYGPALSKITVNESTNFTYAASEQDALAIITERDMEMGISTGIVKNLSVVARENAVVNADSATIQNLEANMRTSARINVGIIQSLVVTDLGSCPSNMREAQIRATNVTMGTMTVNGATQQVKSFSSGCTEIDIEMKEVA